MTRRRLRRLGVALVAAAACLGAGAVAPSRALLSDGAASTVAVSAGTLEPPTGLAASGGPTATLTWTPTVTSGAAGYEIWRTTTSGSGYALVGAVSPASASSGGDAPAVAGTYYYVLRSVLESWRSLDSNEASAAIVFGPTTTGFVACSGAGTPDTGGDGDGYETGAAEGCLDDGVAAVDGNSGSAGRSTACTNPANDRHRFGGFALGLPVVLGSIDGIEVRADVGLNNNGGSSAICVELSWDGGATWTAPRAQSLSGAATATYLLGGPADSWGRIWTPAELAAGAFLVRITDATTQPNKDFRLDLLAVQVAYTP